MNPSGSAAQKGRQPERQLQAVHHQQGANRRPDRPANVQKAVVKRENARFLACGEHVGEPGLQHRRKDGIGAVDQRKEQHHQRDVIDQRDRDKPRDKGHDRNQHVALFIKLIGQNAKSQAEHHADSQRNRQGITNILDAHAVDAREINGHERQRCSPTNG